MGQARWGFYGFVLLSRLGLGWGEGNELDWNCLWS